MDEQKNNEFDFKFLNKIMYLGTAIVIYYFLKNIGIFDKIIEGLLALTPVYLGIIICWLSMPLANKLKKFGLSRSLSAIISLIIIFGIIIAVFSIMIPMFIEQLTALIKELPNIYSSVVTKINAFLYDRFGIENGLQISESIKDLDIVKKYMGQVLTYSITTLQSAIGFIITVGTAIVVSFFMVKDMDKFKETTIDILSKNSKDSRRRKMILEIDTTLNSYIKGVIIDSVIVGIMTTIVCMVLKLDYAIIFGIIIMFLNLIPYLGAIISYTLASLYALTVGGPVLALITFIALFLVQVIDANILQPNIVAKSVKLHPVVVLGGLIVFQLFWGIFGMIIAVPVLAIINIVLKYKFSTEEEIEEEESKKEEDNKTEKKLKFKIKK
ncbi:MAG: AI-2E family transporter [Clostridia bacterium]|nr:AI-2E family transporter [Clostridia bacterium]